MIAHLVLPPQQESPSSRILEGVAPNDEPIVSVVWGTRYAVGAGGTCTLINHAIADEPRVESARVATRFTKPQLLTRDTDLWAWKNFTDVVVRGTVRSEAARESLEVALRVSGSATRIEHTLAVTGHRFVDRGQTGLVISDPVRFTEMPLRYDRAYGGTDEIAEARQSEQEVLSFFAKALGDDEDRALSLFSYPRNPAGKGYLVDPDGARGLAWPNIEFADDRLKLESLARPNLEWGERPYPAGFDWFHHAWFPRSAHVAGLPPISSERVPTSDRRLGDFAPDWEDASLAERSVYPFANGAHPYLCRHRLKGDETIAVSHMSAEGCDFAVTLPSVAPKVSLRFLGESKVVLPASLDLVLVETDRAEVTLVHRATHFTHREHLPIDWVEKTEYVVDSIAS